MAGTCFGRYPQFPTSSTDPHGVPKMAVHDRGKYRFRGGVHPARRFSFVSLFRSRHLLEVKQQWHPVALHDWMKASSEGSPASTPPSRNPGYIIGGAHENIALLPPPRSVNPVPPCTFHSLPQCEFYSHFVYHKVLYHKGKSVNLPPPPDCRYLFLLSGRFRSPTRNRSFSVFA